MSRKCVAILALQGDFAEHQTALESAGASTFQIRQPKDLDRHFDALCLPGGESTVMGKLLRELELLYPLQQKIAIENLPVLATCAGLILLARQIAGSDVQYFGTLDVTVSRNAYGRQSDSFFINGKFLEWENIPMSFIRAPMITEVGKNVEILSSHQATVTAVQQNRQLAMTFHPELHKNSKIFRYFLERVVC